MSAAPIVPPKLQDNNAIDGGDALENFSSPQKSPSNEALAMFRNAMAKQPDAASALPSAGAEVTSVTTKDPVAGVMKYAKDLSTANESINQRVFKIVEGQEPTSVVDLLRLNWDWGNVDNRMSFVGMGVRKATAAIDSLSRGG